MNIESIAIYSFVEPLEGLQEGKYSSLYITNIPNLPIPTERHPNGNAPNSDDHNSRQGEEGTHEEDNTALADDEDEGN